MLQASRHLLMTVRRFFYLLYATTAAAVFAATAANATTLQPGAFTPSYSVAFTDATTYQNAFIDDNSTRRWTIDDGADVFADDKWERPVQQGFRVYQDDDGQDRYATDGDYWGDLDIVAAQAGFDSQYLYASIELHAPTRFQPNGQDEATGLQGEYRLGLGEVGGLLFQVQDPSVNREANNNDGQPLHAWRSERNYVYRDTDADLDVGENPADGDENNGTGYEEEILNDGVLKDGSGGQPFYSRIADDVNTLLGGTKVEFVIDYAAFGLSMADLLGESLLFESNRGNSSSENPDNYLISRRFDVQKAGSPYRCDTGQNSSLFTCTDPDKSIFDTDGLVDVNEVDNLRGSLGAAAVVPLPASLFLVLPGLGALLWLRRRTI